MALNIIVYRERFGWAVKRGDQGRFLAWLRTKEDALHVGGAIAESEKLSLVVLDTVPEGAHDTKSHLEVKTKAYVAQIIQNKHTRELGAD